GAVATLLAGHPQVRPLGPHSTWLTGPDEWPGPAARAFEVVGPLDGSVREQRRRLDGLAVAALTVKSRDTGVAPATVLRELGRREGPGHVVVLTRMGDRSIRVLCRPARGRPA
ncbi:MAG: THUMP-like domain-containing protein, partial [Candidatus Nanopelagicales bacterium]